MMNLPEPLAAGPYSGEKSLQGFHPEYCMNIGPCRARRKANSCRQGHFPRGRPFSFLRHPCMLVCNQVSGPHFLHTVIFKGDDHA